MRLAQGAGLGHVLLLIPNVQTCAISAMLRDNSSICFLKLHKPHMLAQAGALSG